MTNNIDKQSFGEGGLVFVGANTAPPAGQYCAISFISGGGSITTAFTAAEAPLVSGTQTGHIFPDGYTLYTPITIIGGSSTFRANCAVVLYKAL